MNNSAIEFELNSVVTEINGSKESGVTGVVIKNTKTGKLKTCSYRKWEIHCVSQ